MSQNNETRYMTRKEKQAQIKERIMAAPFLSNRAIAKSLMVSHVTVGTMRSELINEGKLSETDMKKEDIWFRHPFVQQNLELFTKLNDRQLRAAKKPGVLELMQSENLTSPVYAMRKLIKRTKIERENAPYSLSRNDIKLYTADIRDGLDFIEDGSVNAIITDPVYSKKYLDTYSQPCGL